MDEDHFRIALKQINETKRKLTWENAMLKALSLPGWSEEFRKEITEAYKFFEKELGPSFLKNEFDRRNHPLYLRTGMLSHWHIREIVYFAQAFEHLKKESLPEKYKVFHKNFLSAERCKIECIPILQITRWFHRNKYKTALEPELLNKRKPDLLVTNLNNRKEIFVEISTLKDSDERSLASSTYNLFLNLLELQTPLPFYYCRLKTSITLERHESVARTIREAILRVYNDKTVEIMENSDFDLGMCEWERTELLDDFKSKHGFTKRELIGVPLNFDESYRLSNNKIPVEIKQLPQDKPGLVIVPVSPIFLKYYNPADAITSLQHRLCDYPNVLGVLLYANVQQPGGGFEYSGRSFLFQLSVTDNGYSKYSLLILNKKHLRKITTAVKRDLFAVARAI